ncbi:MAG: hypothetical protein ACPG49_04895 [Chitinophagales bacterium]
MNLFCPKIFVFLFLVMVNGSDLLIAQEVLLERIETQKKPHSTSQEIEIYIEEEGAEPSETFNKKTDRNFAVKNLKVDDDSALFGVSFKNYNVGKKSNSHNDVEGLNIYLLSRFQYHKTKNGVEDESAFIIQLSFFKNDNSPVGTPTDAYQDKVNESALREFVYRNPSIDPNPQYSKSDYLSIFIPFANLDLLEGKHQLEVRARIIAADSQTDLGISDTAIIEFEQPKIFYAQLLVNDIAFLPRSYDKNLFSVFNPNGHLPDLSWSLYRGEQKIYETKVLKNSLLGPDATIVFTFCEGNHLFFCIKDQDVLDSSILYQEVFPSNGENVIKNSIQRGSLRDACIEFKVWSK